MSSIVISGDTSGAITLAAPAVAGTNTATLPAAAGTVMVSGNMPAFSAYNGSAQALTAGTSKVQYNTEVFDTANCYDPTTNYRFTPNVAGYYFVSLTVATASVTNIQATIYKNGSAYAWGNFITSSNWSNSSSLIYLNGTTDYVEGYCYVGIGVNTLGVSTAQFSGFLARTA